MRTKLVFALVLALFVAGPGCRKSGGPEGIWQGTLKVPTGELRVVFHINKAADGKLSATMDSPDQGANGIAIDTVAYSNGKLSMKANAIKGSFDGTMKTDGRTIDGKWKQGPFSLALVLTRVDKVVEANRPQEPKKPYPYKEEEVEFPNPVAGIKLAGTLTMPDSGGPFGAVALITGSGPEDRNEAVFGHKPFLVLADYLTRRGIAVLRWDDRGVGKSTGDPKTATTADLATDVLAAVAYLKTRAEIAPNRIGLLGHSEGGVIAPMVANQSKDIAFVVLMAGTGLRGDSILMLQSRLVAKAEGASDSTIAATMPFERRTLDIALKETDTAVAAPELRAVMKEALAKMSAQDKEAFGYSDEAIEPQVKQVLSPWFRYFLRYDPQPALRALKVPVLAVVGSKDVQVAPKENLSAIEAALKAGGNKDYTVKELPGLNHLLQTAVTGGISEYAKTEETIAPAALAVMGDWIVAHAAAR